MTKLLDLFTSPVWWISVVVAGILINLISAYLKGFLDKRLSSLSAWWRNRSAKQAALFEARVVALKDNEHEQLVEFIAELRDRIRSVFILLFGVLFMLIARELPMATRDGVLVLVLGIAAGSFFSSYKFFKSAVEHKQKAFEARRRHRLELSQQQKEQRTAS